MHVSVLERRTADHFRDSFELVQPMLSDSSSTPSRRRPETFCASCVRSDGRVAHAAAGDTTAFSIRPSVNQPRQAPFAINRIDVAGTDTAGELLRKVQLGMNDVSMMSLVRYCATRLLQRVRP